MSAHSLGRTRVLAPGKINPTLVVIERRADGFHELDLSFLALDLADFVQLELVGGRAGTLRVEGPMASPDIPLDQRNLARQAADLALDLARNAGLAAPEDACDLRLTKSIPSQAGLGGGSSDAAAAALCVCEATGLAPTDPRLLGALGELGSDAAFFFAARTSGHARGRGRGERIEVLPAHSATLWIALIAPRMGASTGLVYRGLSGLADPDSNRARAQARFDAWSQASSIEDLRAALCNDLEPAAIRVYPELERWRLLLDRQVGGHFRLAGSGSTFFGIYGDKEEARSDLAKVLEAAPLRGLELRGSWLSRPVRHGALALD